MLSQKAIFPSVFLLWPSLDKSSPPRREISPSAPQTPPTISPFLSPFSLCSFSNPECVFSLSCLAVFLLLLLASSSSTASLLSKIPPFLSPFSSREWEGLPPTPFSQTKTNFSRLFPLGGESSSDVCCVCSFSPPPSFPRAVSPLEGIRHLRDRRIALLQLQECHVLLRVLISAAYLQHAPRFSLKYGGSLLRAFASSASSLFRRRLRRKRTFALAEKMSCKERRGKRRAPPFVQEGKIERRRRRQLCSQRKRKKGEERPLSLPCDPRAFCLNGCEEGEGGCLRWESRRGSDCCSGKGIAITFEVRQQRQPQTPPTYNALRRRRGRLRTVAWLAG